LKPLNNFFWFILGLFLSLKCILNQPKQTDLFQTEPKQTEIGLKNTKRTQKMTSFQLQFSKQTETKQKMALKTKKMLFSLSGLIRPQF